MIEGRERLREREQREIQREGETERREREVQSDREGDPERGRDGRGSERDPEREGEYGCTWEPEEEVAGEGEDAGDDCGAPKLPQRCNIFFFSSLLLPQALHPRGFKSVQR